MESYPGIYITWWEKRYGVPCAIKESYNRTNIGSFVLFANLHLIKAMSALVSPFYEWKVILNKAFSEEENKVIEWIWSTSKKEGWCIEVMQWVLVVAYAGGIMKNKQTKTRVTMTNLVKLEFLPLDITGKNYLSWVLDAEIHLDANGIGNMIKKGNETSVQDKAKITDEEMLEKTFSTFHASNMLLQHQYRERGFKKYCDLISCLLVAEQNNELPMKNHETRPTGTAPFPKANMATFNNKNGGRNRGSDRGRGHVRRSGFGQGNYRSVQFKNTSGHKK
ncbi:hypothetical protein Tco_0466439 [Tanacetum coccineum]